MRFKVGASLNWQKKKKKKCFSKTHFYLNSFDKDSLKYTTKSILNGNETLQYSYGSIKRETYP